MTLQDETLPALQPLATAAPPRVGEVLAGRYRLDAELGAGGQGVVFAAEDLELRRQVAIKAVTTGAGALGGPADGSRDDGLAALLEEARMQAGVERPGVARLLDVARDGPRRVLVMERIDGVDLCTLIDGLLARRQDSGAARPDPSWSPVGAASPGRRALLGAPAWDRAVARLGAELAEVVAGLHDAGLVHGDLKPSNVMLSRDGGRPVVLDFGLAGRLDDPDEHGWRGTPAYLPAERLDERRRQRDPRSDVYQLGLILYELLTLDRRHVFDSGRDRDTLLAQARAGRVPPAQRVDAAADAGLSAVIARATAPDVEQRYPSLAPMIDDLRAVAADRPPTHVATPASHRLTRELGWRLRHPLTRVAALAALLAAAAWWGRGAREPELFSFDAWRFAAGDSQLTAVHSGRVVHPDDDLGVRVRSNAPGWLYAVSVFGDDETGLLANPLYPLLLDDRAPRPRDDPHWALALEAGDRQVLCAELAEPARREGLLVLVAEAPVPTLERWLDALDARAGQDGVPWSGALDLLDELARDEARRGRRVPAADEARNTRRYARLDLTGDSRALPDLGVELTAFELLCDVARR